MLYIWIPFAVLASSMIVMMFLNISVGIIYTTNPQSDNADFNIFVRYAFFKYRVLPGKPDKQEKKAKKKEKAKEEPKDSSKSPSPTLKDKFLSKNYTLGEIIEIIKQITGVLIENFGKYLKLRIKTFSVTIATEDAEKTALAYGKAVQSVQYLYEFLNENFKISCDTIQVHSDFSKTHTIFDIDLTFHIKLWQILKTLLESLIKYRDIEKDNNKK